MHGCLRHHVCGRTSTAAMSGVRPMLASVGVSGPEPSTSPKNATPVISSTVGVIIAATPHPYCAPGQTCEALPRL